MNKENLMQLSTLSETSPDSVKIFNQIFTIQTSLGPRSVTLRKVKRSDSCLIADICTPQNPTETTSHIVIDPLKTRIFISQTTLPSHQKPEMKS